ncbi:hypothetical protein Sps_02068 [Shewanella psychrophila]|uniref:Uncharacterized protein n=1 Tax=Shewanella psychrophila TaxID=225848 RepID=A0A1S6HNZ8_9GAMM|nr:hypothetical protein [Shewanella psychrophila]AQS37228.1 hypothetical protein Sps_02068 [Shewanella psychrophila]
MDKVCRWVLVGAMLSISQLASAGIVNPDCTAEKAAKSAVANATVGVKGRCSPAETAKDATTKAVNEALPDEGVAGKAVDIAKPKKSDSVMKKATKAVID